MKYGHFWLTVVTAAVYLNENHFKFDAGNTKWLKRFLENWPVCLIHFILTIISYRKLIPRA